ncbi:hypothetical protein FB451DRAFT_1365227 [Mycena latifolia]|nr:hypothetical protein FB451DRAFT_1365227 [Mycena latifolia]
MLDTGVCFWQALQTSGLLTHCAPVGLQIRMLDMIAGPMRMVLPATGRPPGDLLTFDLVRMESREVGVATVYRRSHVTDVFGHNGTQAHQAGGPDCGHGCPISTPLDPAVRADPEHPPPWRQVKPFLPLVHWPSWVALQVIASGTLGPIKGSHLIAG